MVGHAVLQAMRQIVLSHGYGVRGQETRTVSISHTHSLSQKPHKKPVDDHFFYTYRLNSCINSFSHASYILLILIDELIFVIIVYKQKILV